ncbi:GHKL domain-containing protein [Vicingus serpentipes]|uniref:histidine kinase n=1 Tax=Vicingus serpentipes TaxID=1926625 RepID=A0A5C6RQC6_9FLAO|nr:ATP-binding protein [Vicingus serpentipes]TXB64367.1 GHKL domain-containing protein [Vicingus serpentipes]
MKKQRYIPFIYLIIGVVILLFLELFPHLFYSTSFNIKAFNAVLHQKETIALNKLNELKSEQDNFSSFKNFNSFEEQGISFYVLKDDNIVFWTSATTPIDSLSKFSDDEGIIHLKNGWYHYIKSKNKQHTYLALILIKHQYSISNNYLSPSFHKSFNLHSDIELLFHEDSEAHKIYSLKGKFLFALNELQFNYKSSNWIMVLLFLSAYVLLILFVYYFSQQVNSLKKYNAIIAAIYVALSYFLFTFYSFPTTLYLQKIFSPSVYAHSAILPSLGNFLLAAITLFAFCLFLIKLIKIQPKKNKLYPLLYLILTSTISLVISNWFVGLINNSNINFDVNYILELSAFSFIGIFIVILLFISIVVLIKATIDSFRNTSFTHNQLVSIYWCIGLITVIIGDFLFQIDWTISSWFLILILIFSAFKTKKYSLYQSTVVIALIALSISYGFIKYNGEKNETTKVSLLKKLAQEKDPVTEYLYENLKLKIEADTVLTNWAGNYWENKNELDKYIIDKYFNGYWSKYDVNTYLCQNEDTLIIEGENVQVSCIDFFNEKIEAENNFSANKDITFLYSGENISSYLAKATIKLNGSLIANLFIELLPKVLSNTEGYPELLLNKKEIDISVNLNKQSFAKYKQGQLTNHVGRFNYNTSIVDNNFRFNDDGIFVTESEGFHHLYYQSNKNTIVVLSSPIKTLFNHVTTFSYFFLLTGFIALLIGLLFNLAPFNWQITSTSFSTKVQLFVTISTFISFLLFGWGTSYYIKQQYSDKNIKSIKEKVQSVLIELENSFGNEEKLGTNLTEFINYQLIKFSNIFYVDINLYDIKGNLISTSRPEIIERGLISDKINPDAYYALNNEKKSVFIHDETISSLNYLSAYVPFRNKKNKIIAYLNLPYFSKQNELETEFSSFFTTLINSYTLLFLISAIIAFVFANYISEPVRLIKEKISALQFGKTNDLIDWQSNDEIGSLVHEYNNKVLELEKSANLLAKSERESAWREMAKQVAHEIKNPLTPMKLSIQHLERSITDNPDDVAERVKRTAKTLIEQIDTLTNIANEFSNFAKMPTAKQEKVNLSEIIETCIDLYQDKKTTISYINNINQAIIVNADKDQMNRAFSNLIKNAIQAIPLDRDGVIEIISTENTNIFKLEIKDNGKGIPEDEQGKIFTPNFTTKSTGMGLGLAMVKNIIENANGTITFNTIENVGTSFFIELPKV